jgi:Tfp pilus assembly protein PilF
MLGLRTSLVIGAILLIQACSTPPYLPPHNNMAAKIYTDLALYYWQQGYPALAKDRAMLALQQTPEYQPAKDLLQQIQVDID